MMHDVVHGEEIVRVFMVPDQAELLVQHGPVILWQSCGEQRFSALQHQMFQPVLRLPAFGHGFVRIFVVQVVQREGDAGKQSGGSSDRFGAGAEQPCHFGRWFQVAFGVGEQPPPRCDKGRAFADAGQHIVQGARSGVIVERVASGQKRHPANRSQCLRFGKPPCIRASALHRRGKPDCTGMGLDQLFDHGTVTARGNQQEVVGMIEQVGQVERAIALFRAPVAQRQQTGQPAPATASGGIGDNIGRAIGKD